MASAKDLPSDKSPGILSASGEVIETGEVSDDRDALKPVTDDACLAGEEFKRDHGVVLSSPRYPLVYRKEQCLNWAAQVHQGTMAPDATVIQSAQAYYEWLIKDD